MKNKTKEGIVSLKVFENKNGVVSCDTLIHPNLTSDEEIPMGEWEFELREYPSPLFSDMAVGTQRSFC